jgi:hypothetical protein
MPADAARATGRKVRLDQRRQLFDDVVVHAVVLGPRLLGGIEIETRALAQVIALGIGHVIAAWAGVRGDDDHAVLGRIALRAGLGDEVLLGAGQAAQPIQHRQLPGGRLRRQVHGHFHFTVEHRRAVLVHVLPAAEGGAVFDAFHGHSRRDQ